MKKISTTLFVLLTAVNLAFAQNDTSAMEPSKKLMANYVKTQIQNEKHAAAVKNMQDFHLFIYQKSAAALAFQKLSNDGRNTLVNSLRFSEKGLSSINFTVIERELSVSEAYDLLSMFGFQSFTSKLSGLKVKSERDKLILASSRTAIELQQYLSSNPFPDLPRPPGSGEDEDGFLKGYLCAFRATCRKDDNSACTSNC